MARCQVCDGPVANGRCKLCGMPYRNDEVLYHLNESRDEHYKHATPKAKAQMRANAKPAADRREQQIRAASGGKAGKKAASGQTAGKTARAASADTIRTIGAGAAGRTAYQTRTVVQNQKSTAQEILDKRVQERRQSYESGKMQKSAKQRSGVAIGLTFFVLALTVLPNVIHIAREKYEAYTTPVPEHASVYGDGIVDLEEYPIVNFISNEKPAITVLDTLSQSSILPGEYAISISENGSLELIVQYADSGKESSYVFSDTDNQAVLRLYEGDTIYLKRNDNEENYALFFLIEQYDESSDI